MIMSHHLINARAALIASILLFSTTACNGCGDDESGIPSDQTNKGSQDDMGGSGSSDDMDDLTPTAPPMAAYIVMSADPVKPVYKPDSELTLTATVFDQYNQPFEDQDLTWSADPMTSVTSSDQITWNLNAEGDITFTVCATSSPDICADKTFIVDDAPPTIIITEPTPGQEFSAEDGETITVRGTVTDGSNQASAFLNGQSVTLDDQGNFEVIITPEFGVNHINAVATDDRQQNSSSAELDVLYAQQFYTPLTDGTSGVHFQDGLMLHLGQRFFDDGTIPMPEADGTIYTHDLTDILHLLVQRVDLLSLVPNPIADSDNLTLTIDRIALNEPQVNLHITETGIDLYLSVPAVEIDTQGLLDIEGAQLDLTGGISAKVSILASISLDKPAADQPFDVKVAALDVAIEDATSNFVDEQANAVFTLAESALRLQLENVIINTLNDSFIEALPELLGGALNGLEESLADQTFALDPMLGGEPIDISFAGKIQNAQKDPRKAITLDIDTTLSANIEPTKTSRGVALTEDYVPYEITFIEGGRVQIALRLGVINGLLHGLWNANLLDLDATELLPPDLANVVSTAVVSGKLPPVIRPPSKGENYDLFLEVGQLELQLQSLIGNQLVDYGVLLRAGVNISLENNQLNLTISQEPDITIWVIDTEDGKPATLGEDQLTVLFQEVLWPQLTESIGEGLSLPIPALEISQLGMYAPSLSNLDLQFQEVDSVEVRQGYLIIQANIQGELPPGMP